MNIAKQVPTNGAHDENCMCVGEFRRLNYFYGQMLGVADFQAEQNYFREKLKLHNRCLHGYGVVCGLLVHPVPIPKECNEREEEQAHELWEKLQQLLSQKAAQPAAAPQPPAPENAKAAQDNPPAEEKLPAGEAQPVAAPAPDLDTQIEALRRELGEFYKRHCKDEPRTKVSIDCGMAIDCEGNEVIVRRPLVVDLAEYLSAADYQRVKQGAHEVYVGLCYCESPVDPVRPVLTGTCAPAAACSYGKVQDDVRVFVSVDPPAADERCEVCCGSCENCCVLLACIDCFVPGHELYPENIHNEARRPLSVYRPTTITGVSWLNGHHYTPEEARLLMGTHDRGEPHGRGLEIRFSRPVLVSTIHPGVIDTWIIEGGRGRAANIYSKSGQLVDKPEDGTVDRIFYRDTSDETLQPGDRVLVIVRANFILDHCCQPLDGENIGGRVPVLHEYAEQFGLHPHYHECATPPRGYRPWTTGDGIPGGTFEGWFYVREGEREARERENWRR